jgi:ATP-dependent Zn protease
MRTGKPSAHNRKIAHHEAGHVVAGYYLGASRPPAGSVVTIIPDGSVVVNEAGRVVGATAGRMAGEFKQTPIKAGLAYMMAGEAAAAMLPEADAGQVLDVGFRATKDVNQATEMLNEAMRRACEVVDTPEVWAKIEVLAACLLEAGTIDADCGLVEALCGPLWGMGKTEPTTEGEA